ncbi:initiation-specific alpha-1,6-mannosyltransferase [Metarhizium album ARSEF 1941]|uniref:Initiation-specific alpha-1,6-mannosyltransferase n=1 Tax=Metarhizium album (strain ARSEF 1941) TaxID=1081103 RepID=A0A0B2X7A5_METAS|nr:initiation-specific alpha-1,6-mannosyltransferase [Metarhizium album ARSEF 1941]KHO01370.1 initiation-specific alpha-1,6-mannosyltransferase [Metarhizium album ARSEF 1941]
MPNSRRPLAAAVLIFLIVVLTLRSHSSPAQTSDSSAGVRPVSPDNGASVASSRAVSQKPMMDMSRMSTYDKLAYAYPYDVEAKFPNYIWQTWKTTPADADFAFRDQEASWTVQHPTFVHEVITDTVAVSLLQLLYANAPEVLETYHALPMPVLKADFFRYLILFARGGIYSDIDTYAIRSALEWVPPQIPRETIGLVVGIEADPDRPDWADWYSRRIQFCQWTIQSKPGHPVLRDIITRITNSTLTLKREGKLSSLQGKDVVGLTGPAVWTDTIMAYLNDGRFFDMNKSQGKIDWKNFTGMEMSKRVGDVIVLPITSFSPGVEQMGSKDYDDPLAFVKHDFEGSWKPESERHVGEQD